MVNARLHIICGNCGCNDMFKYKICKEFDDESGEHYECVDIICDNCSTIHQLGDNAENQY